MTNQTSRIAIASLSIGALAWVDPLFIPLITLGPILSGLVVGAHRARPRVAAVPWFCGGLLMLVSDELINHEDAAFHAVVAVLTAIIAGAAAALARRVSNRRAGHESARPAAETA